MFVFVHDNLILYLTLYNLYLFLYLVHSSAATRVQVSLFEGQIIDFSIVND